jgi:hypothetical protein
VSWLRLLLLVALAIAGCGRQPADWQLNAVQSMGIYQRLYLGGDPRADAEFTVARREIASTGRLDLVARAELLRCALRVASLDFDDCPGFAALRADAAPEELDYWEFLSGKRERGSSGEDPLSTLVSAGVQLRRGAIRPEQIGEAVEAASSQGWRRPLLAWLGVQEKRARDAGDADAAAKIRRRIELISG